MATHTTPERLTYNLREAAKALGISETHLRQLIKKGEVPARKFGRRVLIHRSAIDDLFKAPNANGAA